jgi:hypothetical protein
MEVKTAYSDASLGVTYHPIDLAKVIQNGLDGLSNDSVGHRFQPATPVVAPNQGQAIALVSESGDAQVVIYESYATFQVIPKGRNRFDVTTVKNLVIGRIEMFNTILSHLMSDERRVYTGCSITNEIAMSADDSVIVSFLTEYLGAKSDHTLVEISQRYSYVTDDKFYHNIAIQNFREFATNIIGPSIRLNNNQAERYGVQMFVDINNRYAYNTAKDAGANVDTMREVTERAFKVSRERSSNVRDAIQAAELKP